MKDYEIRVIPHKDDHGDTYWTASFPEIDGCVGGGDTPEEAVAEALKNLEFFSGYGEECSAEGGKGER